MGLSQTAAMNVIPTLARLVLAAAFIPAGAAKLFTEAAISGPDATRLIEMGIATAPTTPKVTGAPQARSPELRSWAGFAPSALAPALMMAVSTDQPAGGAKPAEPPPLVDTSKISPPKHEAAGSASVEMSAPPAAPGAGAGAAAAEGPTVHVRSLYMIALMVDKAGLTMVDPAIQAWAAALTEFIGGVLILIGLLSRVWGLGLACVMVVAFYLTSLQVALDTRFFNMPPLAGATMFTQLGLFVLALNVCLVGPGPLSLDRMLTRPRTPPARPQPQQQRPVVVQQQFSRPPTGPAPGPGPGAAAD